MNPGHSIWVLNFGSVLSSLYHSKILEDGRDLLRHQTQEDFQGNKETSKPPGFDSSIKLNAPTKETPAPKKDGEKGG